MCISWYNYVSSRGIFWGHTLPPVLDSGGCIRPGFGELFKAGRRQTRGVSRSLCLGHEGFPRVANSTAPLFWGVREGVTYGPLT